MNKLLLCGSLFLWEAFAQERNFTVGITRSGPIDVNSNSGPVKVDLIQTDIQFSLTGPQIRGSLLTVYDRTSKLVWWTYVHRQSDSLALEAQLTKDDVFYIGVGSIVRFTSKSHAVRECRLRAVSPEDALNEVMTEMDQHILDSRAGRVTITSELGKKEFYIHLNLQRKDFSPEFFGHRYEAQMVVTPFVKVLKTGSKWQVDLKGYNSIATLELSEDFHKVTVLKETPISIK